MDCAVGTRQALAVHRLGCIGYEAGLRWQREAAERVRAGGPDALALLQHYPVYTLGRSTRPQHLGLGLDALRRSGADVFETDRGGSVTFHGPGQLVGYAVLDLRRLGMAPVDYVRLLEAALIEAARLFGVRACRVAGRPGVWAGGAKLAAVGVRVAGGVTSHGFALNVENDLSWFDAVLPCGIGDAAVTSLESLLGHSPGLAAAEDAVLRAFASVFGYMRVTALSFWPEGAEAAVGG